MSEGNIENITKSGSNFAPTFVDHHLLPDINFNGDFLIKKNISIPKKVINLYISYAINPQLRNLNKDFILGNCLLRSIKLIKNADVDKYKYGGYGLGFDPCSEFSLPDGSTGKDVIISGADMSLSVHIDNKGKNIFILGEGLTQGLDDTTFTAEAKYPTTFSQPNRKSTLYK